MAIETSKFAISATDARNNVNSSMTTISRIYKLIKECSLEGQHVLYYDISNTEVEIIKELCRNLENNGFKVTYSYETLPSEDSIYESEVGIIKVSW